MSRAARQLRAENRAARPLRAATVIQTSRLCGATFGGGPLASEMRATVAHLSEMSWAARQLRAENRAARLHRAAALNQISRLWGATFGGGPLASERRATVAHLSEMSWAASQLRAENRAARPHRAAALNQISRLCGATFGGGPLASEMRATVAHLSEMSWAARQLRAENRAARPHRAATVNQISRLCGATFGGGPLASERRATVAHLSEMSWAARQLRAENRAARPHRAATVIQTSRLGGATFGGGPLASEMRATVAHLSEMSWAARQLRAENRAARPHRAATVNQISRLCGATFGGGPLALEMRTTVAHLSEMSWAARQLRAENRAARPHRAAALNQTSRLCGATFGGGPLASEMRATVAHLSEMSWAARQLRAENRAARPHRAATVIQTSRLCGATFGGGPLASERRATLLR